MTTIGHVRSVWRYPVKSMRGEMLPQAFLGFSGVYGDRVYAFRGSTAPKGFPFLTARQLPAMLLHRADFRHPGIMALPPNLAEAVQLAPGATPLYAEPVEALVDVHTPAGAVFRVDDAALTRLLQNAAPGNGDITLLRSDRAFTDCRPLSLISMQTVQQLGRELRVELDERRFRANLYVDFDAEPGFHENEWVGRRLRLGDTAECAVMARDPRCKMITLDPDTGEAMPDLMRRVAEAHDGTAGVYAAVLVEGSVSPGDPVSRLD